jgi:hypothetical protein
MVANLGRVDPSDPDTLDRTIGHDRPDGVTVNDREHAHRH